MQHGSELKLNIEFIITLDLHPKHDLTLALQFFSSAQIIVQKNYNKNLSQQETNTSNPDKNSKPSKRRKNGKKNENKTKIKVFPHHSLEKANRGSSGKRKGRDGRERSLSLRNIICQQNSLQQV